MWARGRDGGRGREIETDTGSKSNMNERGGEMERRGRERERERREGREEERGGGKGGRGGRENPGTRREPAARSGSNANRIPVSSQRHADTTYAQNEGERVRARERASERARERVQ